MRADKIGRYLEEKFMPKQIEAYYTPELQRFEQERENYLLPQYGPSTGVMVSEIPLYDDLYLVSMEKTNSLSLFWQSISQDYFPNLRASSTSSG